MPHVTVDTDVEIAYEDLGGDDPALLFVHGWSCDRTHFAPQARHFGERHRVVSVDLRGHGASSQPAGDYPVDRFSDDLAELIDALGLERPVVVGHSMGGAIAIALGVSRPESVRGVVAVDPSLFFDPGIRELVAAVPDSMAGDDDGSVRAAFVRDQMFLDSDPAEIRDAVSGSMAQMPLHIAQAAFQGIADLDHDLLDRCTVPTMVIWADPRRDDPDELATRMPHVDWRYTPGVGHFNQLIVPEQVNALIEEHLANC